LGTVVAVAMAVFTELSKKVKELKDELAVAAIE
jgi:hypothetical protein